MFNFLRKRLKLPQPIPKSIWALGFVGLLMDSSSELIHSLLPIFIVQVLGASFTVFGMIEGIAESSALIIRIFSGTLSDYLGKRKLLTLIGYGLSALSKPLFPMASHVTDVLAAHLTDRLGKGIRGAPRDALVSDLAPASIRGTCFGIRQALDTLGAFIGPILAMIGLVILSQDIRTVLWFAVLPGIASFFVLLFWVKEPERSTKLSYNMKISPQNFKRMGKDFWLLMIVTGFFTFGRFSDAFLILKARDAGIPISYIPLVIAFMYFIYALAAYPAGLLSDQTDRRKVLYIGLCFFILSNTILAFTDHLWMILLGIGSWGLHLAFTQGLFATMITDAVRTELRGTAFGIFYLISGMGLFTASFVAGILWDHFGAYAAFLFSIFLVTLALIASLILFRRCTTWTQNNVP